jgi:hypothetical protein
MPDKTHAEQVRKRFLKVMKQLIADDEVESRQEFMQTLGDFPQTLSKIITGERYPSIWLLCELCLKYNISPAWILLGTGPVKMGTSQLVDINLLGRVAELEKLVKKPDIKIKKKTG